MNNAKIIIILSTLFSQIVFADILFLNLNGNISSIKAARKAAKVRGEKVIVFPEKRGQKINKQTLKKYFSKMKKKNVDLSSMVLSGHNGGGSSSGKLGEINPTEINEIMDSFPKYKDQIESLYLRGCYSGTVYETSKDHTWRKTFPNLDMIAGYEGAAPSSEKKESKAWMEDMLLLEEEIRLSGDVKDFEKSFKKLRKMRYTQASLWAKDNCSMEREYYVTAPLIVAKSGAIVLSSDAKAACESLQDEVDVYNDLIARYVSGEDKGFERPPVKHHNTKLREAYAFLRKNEHCVKAEYVHGSNLDPEKIIRLIYFDYVVRNFEKHYPKIKYKKAIDWYNKKTGEGLQYPDLKTASRADIGKFLQKLSGITSVDVIGEGEYTFGHKNKDSKHIRELTNLNYRISTLLYCLNEVPFAWVAEKKSNVKPHLYDLRAYYPDNMELDGIYNSNDITNAHKHMKNYFLTSEKKYLSKSKLSRKEIAKNVLKENFSLITFRPGSLKYGSDDKYKNFLESVSKNNFYNDKVVATNSVREIIRFSHYMSKDEVIEAVKKAKAINPDMNFGDSAYQNASSDYYDLSDDQLVQRAENLAVIVDIIGQPEKN